MKTTTRTSTKVGLAVLNESPDQAQQWYRLRKCLAAVQFDRAQRGRIVFLPEGAELCVMGSSRLVGCLEVLCGRQRYSLFQVDLLGPWSTPVVSDAAESRPADSNRIDLGRTAIAVGACA
jgi:hypothetical protein